MLVTTSDVSLLCATFDNALVRTDKRDSRTVPADRLASIGGVLVVALCTCGYLQHGEWLTRALASWLLIELCFFVYQQTR